MICVVDIILYIFASSMFILFLFFGTCVYPRKWSSECALADLLLLISELVFFIITD